jgi:amidase
VAGKLTCRHVDLLTLTAAGLQKLLSDRVLTSADIVQRYLAQIAKHNHAGLHLNAIISVADKETVLDQAKRLDEERERGKLRGPLHGIPILLKVSALGKADLAWLT